MSERDRPRGGMFQRPVGAIASMVVPAVADAVDPDELVDRIDVNALLERIDVEALLDRIDLDKLVARIHLDAIVDRIDVDRIIGRIDLDAIVDRIDVDRVVARVDLDAAADRIDVDRVVARVDLDAAADRIDVDRVVARVDVDAIAASLDIDTIVARSTKGVFGQFIDLLRRQLVGVDEVTMRMATRLLRRNYASLPTGPSPLVYGHESGVETGTMTGRYAGPVSRFGAIALDLFVISATFALLTAGASYLLDLFFGATVVADDSWIPLALALVYGFVYFWLSLTLTGRTVAQSLVGLKVVQSDGRPLGPGAAAIRTVVLPFSFVLLGIGAVMTLVDERRRALHDLVARSSVVYDWGDRPAELPAPLTRFIERREAMPGAVTR